MRARVGLVILLLSLGAAARAQISSQTAHRFHGAGTLPATCATNDVVGILGVPYICRPANTWNTFGSGTGAVSSVSNSDATLTISPTTGAVIASLALAHSNTWTALQGFAQGLTTGSTPTALQDWNAYGDSLTFGDYSTPSNSNGYTVQLQALLPGGWTVNNYGVDSESSNQIAVRTGAIPSFATVSGGSIPTSGGVTVTFPVGYEPSINAIAETGVLAGIPGSVSCTANPGTCTFTRTSSGSAVTVSAPTQFVITPPNINGNLLVWAGHNNQGNPSQVFSNVAQMVSTQPSWGKYLVFAITNDAGVINWAQNSGGIATLYLNNTFANLYGPNYVDVRTPLVTYACGQTDIVDLADCTNGEPATTLRGIGSTTTLNGAINNAVTSITINTPTPGHNSTFTVNDILIVDSGLGTEESMVVTSVSGNTIGVTRAYNVTAQSHSNGAAITDYNPTHFGNAGYGIIASTVSTAITALGSVTPTPAELSADATSGYSQFNSTGIPSCPTGQCALGTPQKPWAGGYFSGPLTINGAVIGGMAGGNLFFPGAVTDGASGAVSAPAHQFIGALYTGGSGTNTLPFLFFQPSSGASAASTWSASGTWLGVNAASGFGGNFFDFRINGAGSSASLSSGGTITLAGQLNATGVELTSGGFFGFSSTASDTGTRDTLLCRAGAAGVLAVESAANCTNTVAAGNALLVSAGLESGGTKFTTSGCSVSSTTGGASAGKMTLGANTCSVVITMNGATGLTATNGWSCHANDETTAAGNTTLYWSANNATTATLSVPATAGTTDVLDFDCRAF